MHSETRSAGKSKGRKRLPKLHNLRSTELDACVVTSCVAAKSNPIVLLPALIFVGDACNFHACCYLSFLFNLFTTKHAQRDYICEGK